jgi:hypothetical protein
MQIDADDKFRIFISHKHDDHDAAETLARAIENLDKPQIRCFVSGTNLIAGSDWNAEIRAQLIASHLLVLLFTEPSKNWDWCLYEAGLFNRLGNENSVVCLYRPGGTTPRPLSTLQGVPAEEESVQRFLDQLCRQTWLVSQRWRRGPVAPKVLEPTLRSVTATIVAAFPKSGAVAVSTQNHAHYPCHRVVLDLRGQEGVADGIPLKARVIEGDGATSAFTLSLFNLTRSTRTRTWEDLVKATSDPGGKWQTDLNDRFAAALREELFSPSKTTPMPLVDAYTGQRRRNYRPVLYEIQREPVAGAGADAGPEALRPLQVTLVLDPVADSA